MGPYGGASRVCECSRGRATPARHRRVSEDHVVGVTGGCNVQATFKAGANMRNSLISSGVQVHLPSMPSPPPLGAFLFVSLFLCFFVFFFGSFFVCLFVAPFRVFLCRASSVSAGPRHFLPVSCDEDFFFRFPLDDDAARHP